jgi:hypothetical protein
MVSSAVSSALMMSDFTGVFGLPSHGAVLVSSISAFWATFNSAILIFFL